MNTKVRQRKGVLREILSAALVLALLAPALGAQGRKGAEVVVTKNDGAVVRGELLAVKGTALLIMDGATPGGASVSLTDVGQVKVIKGGKAVNILGGALLGGAAGAAVGYGVESGNHSFLSGISKAAGTLTGAGIGILAGGLVGVLLSSNKTIAIAGTDPRSVSQAADRLRKLARDRS